MINMSIKSSGFNYIGNIYLSYIFLIVSVMTFVAGCNDDKASSGSSNYLFYERYGAPEVINYIEKYGNDYEKSQSIESGKVYETMVWRSKGVSVKYLYDTGQVVKEEHFSTYSSK